MNNKNYIIAGVVIIAVVVLGYFLIQNQSKQSATFPKVNDSVETAQINPTEVIPTPTEATKSGEKIKEDNLKEERVEYTDEGFIPKSISVKEGTKVTWVNNSKNSMWVASSPHPAHTDLPEFDQLTSSNKGSTYTFTFTRVGNWRYHNHIAPQDTGAVVVER